MVYVIIGIVNNISFTLGLFFHRQELLLIIISCSRGKHDNFYSYYLK